MYTAYLLQFAGTLLIVGTAFRYISMKWPDSWVGRSLAVVY